MRRREFVRTAMGTVTLCTGGASLVISSCRTPNTPMWGRFSAPLPDMEKYLSKVDHGLDHLEAFDTLHGTQGRQHQRLLRGTQMLVGHELLDQPGIDARLL